MSTENFIDALVEDLGPVRPAQALLGALCSWTTLAWFVVGGLILVSGPLREGALASLATSPRYAVEFILAALASATAILAGFELGVPGTTNRMRLLVAPILCVSGWLLILAYGLVDPSIETGMLGKRPYCELQTVLFALPVLGLVLFALHRRAIFSRTLTGALLGLGAAAIPAAWMQFACLYDPLHSMLHHLAPLTVVAILGGLTARSTLPRY